MHSSIPQPPGAGLDTHAAAEGYQEADPEGEPCHDRGLYVYADYLLMKARRRAQDYVIQDPSLDGAVQGNIGSVNYGVSSGYRLGGGYRLGRGWEVGVEYLYFHDSANRVAAPTPGGALYATLTAPGIDQVTAASADANLNLNLINLEVAKRLELQDGFGLRLSGGLQVADISQKLNGIYSGGTAGGMFTNVQSPINFDGIGIRLGGEAWWHPCECRGGWWRGLGLYAKGYGSLLSGEFHSRLTELANGGAQPIVDVSDRFQKLVPVTQLGLGVGWSNQNVSLRVGYELYNFFGLVDSVDFLDSNSFGKIGHRTSDLSLEALVISLGFYF